MPRSNREYLLRYADQSINDIERCLERLQLLSDAYAGVYKPMDGEITVPLVEEAESYDGVHGKYQQFVDVQAALMMTICENMKLFRHNYM